MAWGYWPGCYRPQVSLGVLQPIWDRLGILARLLQAPCWSGVAGLAAKGPMLAWRYWPGCCRPHVGLGVLAWLLQAPGWPVGSGLAATAHRGTCRAASALMIASGYWLLQAPCWPGGTDLASTNPSLAWGYWKGCYMPHVGLGYWPGCCSPKGYWPGCSSPQYSLEVLTWLAQALGWPRGTSQAATGPRLAWGY